MSRTVAALYDTRAEAETARARLSAEVKADSMRILARDTVAAIDSVGIAPKDAEYYREGLRRGGYLLVAGVAEGQSPERIVGLLKQSASVERNAREQQWSGEGWRGYGAAADADSPAGDIVAEERPQVHEELRVGKRSVERGGARVRSIVSEHPAEEQVTLRHEHIEIERRPAERVLSVEEVEAAGLLKERVIEVSEIREEPVVTKETVVREEVVVKKSVEQRTETVRETLRRTDVEVEEIPGERPALGQLSPGRDRRRDRS